MSAKLRITVPPVLVQVGRRGLRDGGGLAPAPDFTTGLLSNGTYCSDGARADRHILLITHRRNYGHHRPFNLRPSYR